MERGSRRNRTDKGPGRTGLKVVGCFLKPVKVQAGRLQGPACETQCRLEFHSITEQNLEQVRELRSKIGMTALHAAKITIGRPVHTEPSITNSAPTLVVLTSQICDKLTMCPWKRNAPKEIDLAVDRRARIDAGPDKHRFEPRR
jgi:hypothetical protein